MTIIISLTSAPGPFCCQVVFVPLLALPEPKAQAATAPEIVMTVPLHARSMNVLAAEKKFEEAYNPKFTEPQKRKPMTDAFLSPDIKVLAPDHFMTMVMKNPINSDVAAIAHGINWSGGR